MNIRFVHTITSYSDNNPKHFLVQRTMDFSNGKLPQEVLDDVWKYVRLMGSLERDNIDAVNKEFTQ